jgi:hypothetical protein
MRNTPDLIAELDDEATEHWHVLMVIGFEDSTIYVRPTDEGRLAQLNSAIEMGGTPVGLITADKTGHEVVMSTRVYPEHEGSEEFDAKGYLQDLVLRVKESWESPGQDA